MAAQSKIYRLPAALKEELNLRLLGDGEETPRAAEVLAWLNAQEETVRVCTAYFSGKLITEQNLSDWRNTHFKDWAQKREKREAVAAKVKFTCELGAAAGLDLSDAADAVIMSGMLEKLEDFDFTAEDADIPGLLIGWSKARAASVARGALSQREREMQLREKQRDLEWELRYREWERQKKDLELREKQQERQMELREKQHALDLEKFKRETCAKFLEFAKTAEAQAILSSGKSKAGQISDLMALLYPEPPAAGSAAVPAA